MRSSSLLLPQMHETFGAQYVKYLFLVSSYRHPYRACVSSPRRLSKICPYNKGSSGYIGYLSLLLNAGAKVSQRLSPSPPKPSEQIIVGGMRLRFPKCDPPYGAWQLLKIHRLISASGIFRQLPLHNARLPGRNIEYLAGIATSFHSCVPFAKWTQSCVFTIYNTTAAVLQPLFCNFVRIGICHKIEGIFLILYANVSLQYELFGK